MGSMETGAQQRWRGGGRCGKYPGHRTTRARGDTGGDPSRVASRPISSVPGEAAIHTESRWEAAAIGDPDGDRSGGADGLNVRIDHKVVTLVACYSDRFQGLLRAFLRSKSITTGLEICLENRLHHNLRRHLHHPVPYRRNPQWPLFPICFRYVSSLHRRRAISACP